MRKRIIAAIAFVVVLLPMLFGCQNKKKFDSAESMMFELKGTYTTVNEYSKDRIVIDEESVIRFNIDNIFPEITDDNFFWENFPNENWKSFNIYTLLKKPYVEITTEEVSVDVKKSTVSGLWLTKDGVLFTRENQPFNKVSSDSVYPTAEMQERFEEYYKYLQEYEKSSIIDEAEKDLLGKQESLETAVSSAASSDSASKKSTASAQTIANCAFESLEEHLKYPRTAKLESYSETPLYDPYGRVATLITVTYQNGYGNYITEDIYVVLQSCSDSGIYSCMQGVHYSQNEDYFSLLLIGNGWEKDPYDDNDKEKSYKEAIELIENKQYQSAADKLLALGDYKSAAELLEACEDVIVAEQYKNAINLFKDEEYDAAKNELTEVLKKQRGSYLKAERVIQLCNDAISNTSNNTEETVPETTAPPETEPETTAPVQEVKQNGNWTWHNMDIDMYLEYYYFTDYAFTEDGTCYLVVMKGEDVIKKGVGTYTVNDNRISITIDGKTTIYDFVYNEERKAYTCTLVSEEKPIEWWNAETKITFDLWREDNPFMLPMEEIIEKAKA